ncbi:MAG: hypothetical protein JSW38_03515 [Dehalococcoidia bacterium]|nr:MAG: hypothetical protein JSV02_01905 [Dehalococcoidia bacterium]UCG83897.1 MAG: hypothetical protein JSW38_03515 [Dehalococcoidia bacterium]
MPPPKRLRKCQACGQFAVYCGKWDDEWVWRCRYCGLVVPLSDEEMARYKLNMD